jgi:hypothetical protein
VASGPQVRIANYQIVNERDLEARDRLEDETPVVDKSFVSGKKWEEAGWVPRGVEGGIGFEVGIWFAGRSVEGTARTAPEPMAC